MPMCECGSMKAGVTAAKVPRRRPFFVLPTPAIFFPSKWT